MDTENILRHLFIQRLIILEEENTCGLHIIAVFLYLLEFI